MVKHPWPGNLRQFGMVLSDLLAATLYGRTAASLDRAGRVVFAFENRLLFDLLAEARQEEAEAWGGDVLPLPRPKVGNVEDYRRELERSAFRQLFHECHGRFRAHGRADDGLRGGREGRAPALQQARALRAAGGLTPGARAASLALALAAAPASRRGARRTPSTSPNRGRPPLRVSQGRRGRRRRGTSSAGRASPRSGRPSSLCSAPRTSRRPRETRTTRRGSCRRRRARRPISSRRPTGSSSPARPRPGAIGATRCCSTATSSPRWRGAAGAAGAGSASGSAGSTPRRRRGAFPSARGSRRPRARRGRAFAEGKAFLARGANAGARDAFRRALRISPGYVEAALALGTLEERDGRDVEAAAAFRTALAADPDRFDAVLALANLLWNEPDRPAKEESLALLDRAIALRPEQPRLLREAADRWAAWGDPARALERLDAWRASATPAGRQATDAFREKLAASLARPAEKGAGAPVSPRRRPRRRRSGSRRSTCGGATSLGRARPFASWKRPYASIRPSFRPGSSSPPCGAAAGTRRARSPP